VGTLPYPLKISFLFFSVKGISLTLKRGAQEEPAGDFDIFLMDPSKRYCKTFFLPLHCWLAIRSRENLLSSPARKKHNNCHLETHKCTIFPFLCPLLFVRNQLTRYPGSSTLGAWTMDLWRCFDFFLQPSRDNCKPASLSIIAVPFCPIYIPWAFISFSSG
jgi:hypothetical protein